jgi:hypothetical protein
MYCGNSRSANVGPWLQGLEYGITQLLPDQADEIDGFREWLHMRLDGPGETNWIGLISRTFGDDEEATQRLFEQFDLFRKETAARGLPAIIEEHKDYEMRKYGEPMTSRLGGIVWRPRHC